MGGKRTYAGRGGEKGKGVGTATKAVAKDATLHLDLLRAYTLRRTAPYHSPQWGQVGLAAS